MAYVLRDCSESVSFPYTSVIHWPIFPCFSTESVSLYNTVSRWSKGGQHQFLHSSFSRCLVRLVLSTTEKSSDEMRWGEGKAPEHVIYSSIINTTFNKIKTQIYINHLASQHMQDCESGCSAAIPKNGWVRVQQGLTSVLGRNVSAPVSAVHHNPQMFCLPSLQLCRKFHTSLAWLLSSAQRKLTGSGRLVLFLSLSLQSDMVCYHLKSCSTFIFSVCMLCGHACVCACPCVCPCYSLELCSAVRELPRQNERFLGALLPGKCPY